jgi:predicted NAD/FAD-binding protein
MRIAIIGSGISGLVSAYHLHREHEVTIFEANDYIGGHSNTASVELDGVAYSVDTGFIVFNDWTYPNFIQLLEDLKVESQSTEMSFSVRDQQSGLEYNGHSLNTLFAQRRNIFRPRFYRMVADIVRFNRQAKAADFGIGEAGRNQETTVGEFLKQNDYSTEFQNHYLLPMGAAIWSCPPGVFAAFPIRFIAEFYKNHGLLNVGNRPTWRVIKGGSQTYVKALVRDFESRIRLNSPVVKVIRSNDGVDVSTSSSTEQFDHVVFACHSDQALKILSANATKTEHEILSEFPYSRNVAILHTDETMLPTCRRAWASWNYLVTGDDRSAANVTYNMSLLQQIESPHTFCLTLNGESRIAPDKVLRRYIYHHPVFTLNRAAAQARHSELIDSNRTSFCGAYWGNGFHEDGVRSALAVVASLARADSKPLKEPTGNIRSGAEVVGVIQ